MGESNVIPKSARLIVVVAETPRRELPLGSLIGGVVGPSTSRTVSLVTPWMVRSPVTFNLPAPADSTFFDWKVIVGYLATSKKWSLRRSLSRISTRVSTELASMVTFTEALLRSGESTTTPLTLVKAPLTVEMPIWRTENCAAECGGSRYHVWVCAEALAPAR